jgi:creatinine amidohydrolase
MPVHFAAGLTWPDVRALDLARTVAVLPTGALEAHGPHLPLATDVVIAEAMAREGAERLSAQGLDVLVLPAIPYAPAPFAARFPGTVDPPSAFLTLLVAGIARSLGGHGVRTLAIANAHHDPAQLAALRAAATHAGDDGAQVVFPDLTRRKWAERLTQEFRSGACHAGRYEGAIVLAERPQWVKQDVMGVLAPNPRSLVDAIQEGKRTFDEAGGGEAYFGFPADATAEEGRAIVATLGAILAEAVLETLAR